MHIDLTTGYTDSMDNLPSDPPDQNNNSNSTPPPFGSNFNPHVNPPDPNNPYQQPPTPPPQNPTPTVIHNTPNQPNNDPEESKHTHYSEAAKEKPRDEHGRFINSQHSTESQTPIQSGQTSQTTQTINPPNYPSFLPPIIEVNKNTHPSDKKDPPLFGFFITNPVTYLKKFLKMLLKRQMITLRIPVLAILLIAVGLGGYGVGLKTGIDYALGKLFPNFSPILHRSITAQGTIQKSSKGYFLQANDKAKSLWLLKPSFENLNLSDFIDLRVQIKGNLTPTPNLIEVSEIIAFDTKPSPTSQTTPDTSVSNTYSDSFKNASANSPLTSSTGSPTPNSSLPALYSNLTWESPKNKTLTFTSGTRKIEQEVIYIESTQVNNYPQDFISYYTQQLTNSGFKQTLNSQEPNNSSITYSKANLFLTFGIKNIYSQDKQEIVGYKAYIEHN